MKNLIFILFLFNASVLVAKDSLQFVSATNGAASHEFFYYNNYLDEITSIYLGNSQYLAKAVTVSNDTVWSFFKNIGLVKFVYKTHGLYAFDKNNYKINFKT